MQLGVTRNTLVGLLLERTNDLVVAMLGIIKAGGAYLPIDLAYPAERVAYMLEDAQASVLITQRSLRGQLPAGNSTVLCVDDVLALEAEAGWSETIQPVAGPEDLAYVIYTSGTTGKPKGSMITHRNVVRLFSQTERWFGFGAADTWCFFHSIAFDFSVWEIWGALLYGGRLVVVPYLTSRSPKDFYQLLVAERVTVLNQTPSAFRQLMQVDESVDPLALALRWVIFGGEALELRSLEPWFERHGDQHPQLVNMYGITETTVHVTYRPVSRCDLESGSVIGVPIPDLQVFLLDARQQPVPQGVAGEIYVGGAGLARGYLRRPELTSERFVRHPFKVEAEERLYRTGDLARQLPDGDIEYLGRIDHQVKLRGFRIELGEIEFRLSEHPAVTEALVLVREDLPGEKRLVAYCVCHESVAAAAPSVVELRQHLKRVLPDYMVPAAFVFLSELPLTAHGKVDRRALPVPENQPVGTRSGQIAPNGVLEETITKVCRELLRMEGLSVEDNFFDLGAHSILMVRMHQRLIEELGRDFPLVTLFHHPTVRGLAQHLGEAVSPGALTEHSGLISERARKQRDAMQRMRQPKPNRQLP
jgi:amino acid adenylation domain-containing protein